jgi:hypothetical protein
MKWVEIHMIVDCMGGRGFMREKWWKSRNRRHGHGRRYRREYLPYEEVRG